MVNEQFLVINFSVTVFPHILSFINSCVASFFTASYALKVKHIFTHTCCHDWRSLVWQHTLQMFFTVRDS